MCRSPAPLRVPVSRHGGYITLLKSDGETKSPVTMQEFCFFSHSRIVPTADVMYGAMLLLLDALEACT